MSFTSACCSLPPIQAEYTPKGEYTEIAGLKTYVVGPSDASKAILMVYDIFGLAPQTIQGADLLSSQGYKVYLPDFLVGKVADGSWFSPSATPEQTAAKNEFFGGFPGAIGSQIGPVGEVTKFIKESGVKSVGVVGYCWGYKVAVMSQKGAGFDAIAGCHPSFGAPEDADAVNVPLALLASQNEDKEIMNKIFESVESKNKGKNILETYDTMPHGWMAARGDLSGNDATEQYKKGYETLVSFFKASL